MRTTRVTTAAALAAALTIAAGCGQAGPEQAEMTAPAPATMTTHVYSGSVLPSTPGPRADDRTRRPVPPAATGTTLPPVPDGAPPPGPDGKPPLPPAGAPAPGIDGKPPASTAPATQR